MIICRLFNVYFKIIYFTYIFGQIVSLKDDEKVQIVGRIAKKKNISIKNEEYVILIHFIFIDTCICLLILQNIRVC